MSSGTGRGPGSVNLAGQAVSHFRVLKPLGRGGMGVVYKAEDTRLNRVVALKFLAPELTLDPEAKERFLQEARTASQLDHPNICTIYEVDETADGQLYLAMPYYEGETLKERIERGPLPLSEALHLAIQIARGLGCAHEFGVTHRDIKPANIMVTRRGQAKILDFGVAKLLGETGVTRPGSVLGTPAYMSPEQARGAGIDHRSDLWSLGVALYEMLTGLLPFHGDTPHSILLALTLDSPMSLRRGRNDLPEEVEHIVNRALAKDPRERYQSANEMIADLESVEGYLIWPEETPPPAAITPVAATALELPRPFHTDPPPPAPPLPATSLLTGSPQPRSRRRTVFAVLAACLLPVLAGLGWLGWRGREEAAAARPAADGKTTILVLPFENLGPSEDAYFSAGVTEEITSRLVGIRQLAVVAYSATLGKDLRQVSRELGADYVLAGTVRWQHSAAGPSRVRITPSLIRVADETRLWSERYDRVIDEIFTVQSEVAEKVIDQLGLTLRLPERKHLAAERSTENLEAYELYLRGRHFQHSPDVSAASIQATVEAYQAALELDPSFALALARLSQAHSFAYHLVIDRTPERLAQARQAADRALELQPDLPEGHLALAYYYYWGLRDYDAALRELETVSKARPNSAEVLAVRGYILRRQGDHRAALESLERALALDPGKADLAYGIAISYDALRDFANARKFYDRAITLSPEAPAPYAFQAYSTMALTGSTAEAIRIMDEAPRNEDPFYLFHRIWMDVYARDFRQALERIEASPVEVFKLQEYLYPRPMLRAWVQHLEGQSGAARPSWEEARGLLEAEVRENPEDGRAHSALGIIYAGLGRKSEAIREGRAALAAPSSIRDDFSLTASHLQLAWIYTMVGDQEAALDEIELLLHRPSSLCVPLLRADPRWDPLRSNPRFRRLVAET